MIARPSLADLVYAGLRRTDAARSRVDARYDRGALSPVEWRTAMAAVYAREARWWSVLSRVTVADQSIPVVYITAVGKAQAAADHRAEEWARSAEEHALIIAPAPVGVA